MSSNMVNARRRKKRRQPQRQVGVSNASAGAFTLTGAILPVRMTRTFTNAINMYWAAGKMTAAAGNYFCVSVNAFNQPFNTMYPYNQVPAPTYGNNASSVQGSTLANNAIGYNNVANLYSTYRVNKYKITVKGKSDTSTDDFRLVVFPLGDQTIPNSNAVYVNLAVMEGQPGAQAVDCINAARPGTITHSMTVWDNLGWRKSAWMASNPSPLSAVPTQVPLAYVGIFCQQLAGSNNSQTCILSVVLEQEVELTDPIQFTA